MAGRLAASIVVFAVGAVLDFAITTNAVNMDGTFRPLASFS